ncbi:MAG: hypothetical protein IIX86_08135, partial [Clostridia bacterium]|nr:hypothetical protein [Clostridia bacterium]
SNREGTATKRQTKKERIKKDVRYQERREVTLDFGFTPRGQGSLLILRIYIKYVLPLSHFGNGLFLSALDTASILRYNYYEQVHKKEAHA